MMSAVPVVLQIIVLVGLVILLLAEEYRYRHFQRRVESMRLSLQALSDQIRSPLALLRKYHRFLRRQEFGDLTLSQQEILSGVDRAIADVVVSHNRLLTHARIENHAHAGGDKVLSVETAVRAAANAVRPAAEARRQSLDIAPARRMAVEADTLVMHGILDELLMNAILYMKPGGTIRVAARAEGPRVEISVQDAGIGIGKEEQPRVFEKFFRGEAARSMAPGTGLGLFFARQLAKDLKGDIRFTTRPGKGTTFVLSLPLAKKSRTAVKVRR